MIFYKKKVVHEKWLFTIYTGEPVRQRLLKMVSKNPWWYVPFSLATYQLLHNPQFTERAWVGRVRTDHNSTMVVKNCKCKQIFHSDFGWKFWTSFQDVRFFFLKFFDRSSQNCLTIYFLIENSEIFGWMVNNHCLLSNMGVNFNSLQFLSNLNMKEIYCFYRCLSSALQRVVSCLGIRGQLHQAQ